MARSSDPLHQYRTKRDFGHTSEPPGLPVNHNRAGTLSYVVQRHQARRLHYDFRLELDGTLKSWAIPKGPSRDPAVKRLAVQVEDHPVAYGEFEGDIPAGNYGAGHVDIWDSGIWMPEGDARQDLARGRLHFRLEGSRLQGEWILIRTGKSEQWLLRKLDDEYSVAGDEAEHATELPKRRPPSRPSRRATAALPRGPMPALIEPPLATLVKSPPRSLGWSYEVKYDGYRILCKLEGGRAHLLSRSGGDWTARMQPLARALESARLGEGWLDGEVVVFNDRGHSDFQALQQTLDGKAHGLHYVVFDLPFWDGHDLRELPLETRQRQLAGIIERAPPKLPVSFTDKLSFDDPAAASVIMEQACALGLEGLIAKKLDGPYPAGRTKKWIKLKCRPRQEFIVGGYTRTQGSRSGLGALLVGVMRDGELVYTGRVGSGFSADITRALEPKLRQRRITRCPFSRQPASDSRWRRNPQEISWVRPDLVIEANFAGWTDDGLLRQASFAGTRNDKHAHDITLETPSKPEPTTVTSSPSPSPAGVRITHPERTVYPDAKLSKLDVAQYYADIAPYLMPHLRKRRLALLRCPSGLAEKCFFQKHLDESLPTGLSRDGEHILVSHERGLVELAQRGVLELHTWGSSLPKPDRPDRLTLDLDPGDGVAWRQIYEAALLARALMEALGLVPFVKTTGGKGLHVVTPIRRTLDWNLGKAFARAMAEHLAEQLPDRFTANMNKSRRKGRIFVDYLRNGDNATAIAAFSLRARSGAPVSVPVSWDELEPDHDLRGDAFNLRNVLDRVSKQPDPWAAYGGAARTVTVATLRQMGVQPEAKRRERVRS